MTLRTCVALSIGTAALLWAGTASAQPAAADDGGWQAPRTPWGVPDLQGVWTNTTTTPLERPDELADREVLTDEERAELDELAVRNADQPPRERDTGAYNSFWLEKGLRTEQTSLIVAPPDGKLPAFTPAAHHRVVDLAAARKLPSASWTDLNVFDRCIARGMPGAMMPGFYNHNYHILQSPGYVVIALEMLHDVRVIPLDGRPHIAQGIAQWLGDSRGRWEGDTLVVETTNVANKVNEFRRSHTVFGASRHVRLVERFRRTGPDRIDYTFTVDDPTTFVTAWTGAAPLSSTEGPLYEYACHEGNYAMEHILRGARAQDGAGADFNPVAPLTLIRGGNP